MPTIFDKLEKEIDERQSVLFEIEKVLFTNRYQLSQKHLNIFTVQSISMIYAIWEGYVQNAFRIYIDELNGLGINHHEIGDDLLINCFETNFKQLYEYPKKPRKKIEFYIKLNDFFSREKVELTPSIDTKSNISFETLNSILSSFCLEPFPEYWKTYKHPNPNLKETLKSFLRYRNGVAHGGDISSEEKVSQTVFGKYKNLVIDLMYELLFKMEKGITEKTYLK